MAFIRTKTVKGVNYFYLVENKRVDGKVKQTILQYFGTTVPDGFVVPTEKRHTVVAKEAIKKVGTTKTMGKVEASEVPSEVSTTPVKSIDKPVSTTPISTTPEAKEKNVQFGVSLPLSQYDLIKAESAKLGYTVSWYCRKNLPHQLPMIS